jgi:DNA-binding NarL/FixJ family response regulator
MAESLPTVNLDTPLCCRLEPHQVVILQACADGESTASVAVLCGWSVQSLKNRLRPIYEALGADNRAHAIALAMRRKIIS